MLLNSSLPLVPVSPGLGDVAVLQAVEDDLQGVGLVELLHSDQLDDEDSSGMKDNDQPEYDECDLLEAGFIHGRDTEIYSLDELLAYFEEGEAAAAVIQEEYITTTVNNSDSILDSINFESLEWNVETAAKTFEEINDPPNVLSQVIDVLDSIDFLSIQQALETAETAMNF